MSRPVRIIAILLALLVLAYPLEAALSGLIVEHQLHRGIQRALRQTPYVALTRWNYQRGIYAAHEQATFTVRPAGLRGNGPSWQLSVRQTIHHGPIPQARTFALATIDTELVLPPATAAELKKVLGAQSPLQIHSTLGWLGGSRTAVSSPAFQAHLDGGVVITSQGLVGSVIGARNGSISHVDLTAPGFSVADDKYRVGWTDLAIRSSGRRVFGLLRAGKADGSIKAFQLTSATGEDVEAHDLSFATDTSVRGDFMDMQITFKAASLQARNFAATDLDYEVALQHLHGPSLAVLIDNIRTINADSSVALAVRQQQIIEELRGDGVGLLTHDPVFEISRMGFKTTDGNFNVAAKVTASGLQRSDLGTVGLQSMLSLMQKVQVSADISVDQGLITKWTATGAKANNSAAQIAVLESQGYIKLDRATLTSHLDWAGGRLRVNGKPFPPGAAGR